MMRLELHFQHPILQSKYQTETYGPRHDIEIVYQVDHYYVRDGVLYILTKKDVFDDQEVSQVNSCYPIVNLKKWVPYSE